MPNKTPQMDWQQVALNGGPPCFFVEGPQYCGRAERWPGHGNEAFHDYVSLDDLLTRVRAGGAAPVVDQGWLLEKIHNGQVWYITANNVLEWTDDPLKALRLSRREDAEMLATIVEDCERIEEHQWG